MQTVADSKGKPAALTLLVSERPRNVGWLQAAGLLFGDWGTSRLYVLGLALFFAGRSSFWLIVMMSLLILAVGWAYTQICRIYPDGGGVYTAAKKTSRILAVVGALLLFADYTVTASLSVLDGFHYFGLGNGEHTQVVKSQLPTTPKSLATPQTYNTDPAIDAGSDLDAHRQKEESSAAPERFFALNSPGLWACVAIGVIGMFNLMGPKHTGAFAVSAAIGMVFITLLISAFALPQVPWHDLPKRIGHVGHQPADLWVAFVSIVLALSGVEAIANLTGVMKRPVTTTANKAIWAVATEVAVFNVVLAAVMLAIPVINRDAHLEDMAAFLTGYYVGPWGEWAVRIVGGMLLLSAGNTAITDMISIQYLMARDGELPHFMVKLNRFGVPWLAAMVAAGVPIIVLLVMHDLDKLAALYAIGVIGAVAINVTLCALHPRLRKAKRKIPMFALGIVLLLIWITLAFVKHEALLFVTLVMVVGLGARQLSRLWSGRKGPKPSLIRQAIIAQLTPAALSKPRMLLGTYGSDRLALPALQLAQKNNAALVVCFVRQVSLSYKYDSDQSRLSLDSDLAAQRTFAKIMDLAHDMNVSVIPVYDSGHDAAEALAETAAMTACERVLIGSSRQGALYRLIKGAFQQQLEALLPPEIPVEVINPSENLATVVT